MEWILVTGYTFLFIALILKLPGFEIPGIRRIWLVSAFCLKVIAGISLGLIYTYVYPDRSTADTFKFFDDSKLLFNTIFTEPYDFIRMFTGIDGKAPELREYYVRMNAWLNTDVMFNDNKTIIRLNVLFQFFSLGNYYVHVVFINFISFIGLLGIFKTFRQYLPGSSTILFLTTFFIPSVVFWGSGLLKDGLLLFAFGLLIYSFNKIVTGEFKIKNYLIFLISFFLLLFTKLYVIMAIFPGLLAWYWARKNQGRIAFLKFSISYLLYVAILFNIHHLIPKYNVAEILYWKQQNFYVLAELTQAKSVIQIPPLGIGVWSIISNSPTAFFNTLLRPFPGDVNGNMLILISAIESIAVLVLGILAVLYRKKPLVPIQPIVLFSICFIVLIFILSGLITPILGALVRYKVPALPFLIFLFLVILDTEKLKKRIASIRKK
ncbi:MAG: hypothetical protein KA444_07565 [Bacteroidia bacterium]|nr:hypothetical protein [Bacteroidia bacterium]